MKSASPVPIAGVFVGGRSLRMGGTPKGLLPHPITGQPIVEYILHQVHLAGFNPVLVGHRPEYAYLPQLALEDEICDVGPAGGLLTLCNHAQRGPVLALACDMPFIHHGFLQRLLSEFLRAGVEALIPRRQGRWEPLCAIYDAARFGPHVSQQLAIGERSLYRIARQATIQEWPVDDTQSALLTDWDSPEDVS